MATKATWKKYGIDMNDYTGEQRQTYDSAAGLMLHYVCTTSGFKLLAQAHCAKPVKTLEGVEYYQYWDVVIPGCVNTAILHMAEKERAAYIKLGAN